MPAASPLYTVGHGTRSLGELLAVLSSVPIGVLVDVRRFPGSRRHPHFARAELGLALREAGVEYVFEGEALGGRRSARRDSPHVGLRVLQFRGYADHMETPEFAAAIDRVLRLAGQRATAVMCAERHWTQCHRRLIADYAALARGSGVVHLLDAERRESHVPLDVARVVDGRIAYDGGAASQGTLF